MNMLDVAGIVWKQCLMAEQDEKALIIADPSGERLEIGKALLEAGKNFCKCELVTMKPTGMSGREPWPEVAGKILEHDIVVAPLEYSITHTKAMEALKKKGGRGVTMPGITKEIFLRAIPVDYAKMAETNGKLKAALESGSRIRVTTTAGTGITMHRIGGRRVLNGSGIIRPGKVKNLPDGEVGFAPTEGTSNGVIVFDLSSLNTRLEKPFKVVVKEGIAVSCENRKLWEILKGTENGTNMAEFSIGTNPKARITGNILEDEKVKGTAHIAFGTSAAMGGLVQTSVHLDSVFDKPTVEVDGKIIIKDGRFMA